MLLNYDKANLTDEDRTKFQDLTRYSNSLDAYWSAFLSDYDLWPEGDPLLSTAKVAYALFITVIILNLMSMYYFFFFSHLTAPFLTILFFDSCTCK
jgi:hypothetical protein